MQVEINDKAVAQPIIADGAIMITPNINEHYWLFRVHMQNNQYINAFPKFGTIGIGFSQEEDWNTNLPYDGASAKTITNHIFHNKKYPEITKQDCIKAITKLQEVITAHMTNTRMGKDKR